MSKTIIFTAAPISDKEWVKEQVKFADRIICADSGAHHTHELNIIPDVVIGDFDSIHRDVLDYYNALDSVQTVHDPDQYTTDLMKALNLKRTINKKLHK